MHVYLVTIVLMLFTATAWAEPWDNTDKLLGMAAIASLAVDWGQTRYVAKHPAEYHETNRLLGDYPSVGKGNAHFVGAMIGTYVIADWLTPTNRKLFLGTITAIELVVAQRNRAIGVSIAF